jgi:4-oxalocrotonate tautomerase
MAIVKVTILKGRDQAIKDRLVQGITDVMTREIDPDPSHIRVVIDEVEPGNYAVGGKTLTSRKHAGTDASAAEPRTAGQS